MRYSEWGNVDTATDWRLRKIRELALEKGDTPRHIIARDIICTGMTVGKWALRCGVGIGAMQHYLKVRSNGPASKRIDRVVKEVSKMWMMPTREDALEICGMYSPTEDTGEPD